MTNRADAHIHLFAGGYQDKSFASRPGVSIDEVTCYDDLAREHNVVAALVVGYGGEDWCADNNLYLAKQTRQYDWLHPVAYVAIDIPPTIEDLENLHEQGFVGISLFLFGDDVKQLEQIPISFWSWIEAKNWLVSVNSEDDAWTAWQPVLQQSPKLRLIISHLGQPRATTAPPSPQQAAQIMQPVTELSKYPGIRVKLSGFYSLTSSGHDYPHEAAWPYVEQLVGSFSCDRLLWGSDFIPCLDWITFPQTIDIFEKIPFLSESDVSRITGGNMLALLDEVKSIA